MPEHSLGEGLSGETSARIPISSLCTHWGPHRDWGEGGGNFQARQASKLPNMYIWGDVWKYLLVSVIFAPIFCRQLKPCTCLGLVTIVAKWSFNHPTDITLLPIIAARDRSHHGTLGSGMPQGQGWNSSPSETWQNCLTRMGGCGRCP